MRIAGWFKRRMRTGFGSGTAATMALDYVSGPADGVSTDNALARWDGATGRLVQNSGATLSDAGVLTLAVGGGNVQPNVADVTNFERARRAWAANVFEDLVEAAGSGTQRAFKIGTTANNITFEATTGTYTLAGVSGGLLTLNVTGNGALRLRGNLTTSAGFATRLSNTGSLTGSSGTQGLALIDGTFNQSGSAAYKALRVDVAETAVGTGQKDLLSLEVGSAVKARISNTGHLFVDGTVTPGGTTGPVTIDKPSGTVNFAAAATSLVLTNARITANSTVLCVVRTNDATMKACAAVAAAGSATLYPDAAPTAETSVGFFVLN